MVRPPSVLVADEVTLGLAPTIVVNLLGYLRELRASGVSILMVEEKARHLIGLADYCAFLSLGKVVAWGPMDEFSEELAASSYLGMAKATDVAVATAAADADGG
jgi:ABC-type branched-subunit amino acid transport system ATPase component